MPGSRGYRYVGLAELDDRREASPGTRIDSVPDLARWLATQDRRDLAALDRAGISHPEGFTAPVVFRCCPDCGERNIVRDGVLLCAVCDAELPEEWNFGVGFDGCR